MKKLITLMIGLILIGIISAQPPVPSPVKIFVKVNNIGIDYSNTKVTNLATGEVLTKGDVPSLEIKDGIGMFDLSQFTQGYEIQGRTYTGDVIEIKACDFDAKCTYSFTLKDTSPKTVEIIIGDITDRFICWNGQIAFSQEECPSQSEPVCTPELVETIIKQYICLDGSVVSESSLCPPPEQNNNWIIAVIATLAALFMGAGGWRFYNGKFKHYHYGVTGYHDPNTKHINPKYRHTLWKENAMKCISDAKKIQQGIDLSVQ